MPRPPNIFRGERPPRAWQRGMSIRAFCKTYGVGRTKVYAEIHAGRLKARKAGRRTIIGDEAAEEWWRSLPELQEGLR
jgi:excisionase family DNA binding protein